MPFFGDLNLHVSFIKRSNIQCPFLGGSFIRGVSVFSMCITLPVLSLQEAVLKQGFVSTTSLTDASLAVTVNFYTVHRKSWQTKWPIITIHL